MDFLTNTGIYKVDKSLRRYGVTIERALASWEISPQEWADYIAFLGRLLKVRLHALYLPLLCLTLSGHPKPPGQRTTLAT